VTPYIKMPGYVVKYFGETVKKPR